MTERGERWGIVPAYHGWQGELVVTPPETEAAILAAMGAESDRPPPVRRPRTQARRCAPAPDRAWGWAVQLYALRSRESWGIGDLADLRRFARWARLQGASSILLNPLGAQTPTHPYQPSPYYPSSRRFRNLVFLRVDEVDGALGASDELESQREAAHHLNAEALIDYDRVFELKNAVLEQIFRAAPDPPGLRAWATRQGQALTDFATFNALCEIHGPAWRSWPEELRHPRSPRVAAARRELEPRVAYHRWIQFQLDRQLARAGREIGLITDVPVGFAADGFDAWRWQDYIAGGIRVGAPPDEFFRDGQDWGLPALNPWTLGQARWLPFAEALRAATRHASGVRLDHVMGLFRLFWIPDGLPASGGAYVRYPAPALLRVLADESMRAGAFVIGEDLGLVEPRVRRHLREKGSLSYRLLWFEGSHPSEWPHEAVAAVGTHDLPTIAGIWTLSEPEHRLHHLRQKLVDMTRLPDGSAPIDVAVAAYGELARGRPRLVLASLEDALAVHDRPNVPGTTSEFPNWRRSLPRPLEEIEADAGVHRIVETMRAAGRSGDDLRSNRGRSRAAPGD